MTRASTDRPTVLVVDDERELADAYGAWLATEYEVRTAYDGEAALDGYDEDVDVVLLDRRMPGMSGDEVLARIREADDDCRVAMVTAVEPDVDVFDLGFDDYVVKPVMGEELRSLVDRLVRRATYDDRIQEHYALVSKRVALEEHNPLDALEDSEEYAQLVADIEELERELDAESGDMSDEDFTALLRRQDSVPVPDRAG